MFLSVSLTHTTGVLSTTSQLNRESIARHELTIMVRDDQGVTSKRSLARVVVDVSDYNDHAPEFLTSGDDGGFEGSVHETAAVGSTVLKVVAIDRDHGVNAKVTYSIVSGKFNGFLWVVSVGWP